MAKKVLNAFKKFGHAYVEFFYRMYEPGIRVGACPFL